MPHPYEFGPFPALDKLTAIQLALWDNGPEPKRTGTGRKSNGQRHKLIIEGYDQPIAGLNKRIYAWKRTIALRFANPFLKLTDTQKTKGTIDADYHKALGDAVLGIPVSERDGYAFGQVYENHDGWRFFPFQYVVVKMSKGEENPVALILSGDERLVADRMNSHFAKGNITHTTFIDLTSK